MTTNPVKINKHRWEYFRTKGGWDVYIPPPDSAHGAVVGFRCSEPRIRIVSRAVEIADALRQMRVACGRHGGKTDPDPFVQVVDGLPDVYDLQAEASWGLERYPWGAPRFIYEVETQTAESGGVKPPDESKRVTEDSYELRRVREHIVGDIVRALGLYWSLRRQLKDLGVR